jgi:hypothetical protein
MTYDRIDWHLDSALEAGQPPENAFAHIGLYLAWLIRSDLHDPELFPAAHVAAVKAGEMTGSDLADDVDGKLLDVMMTAEGRSFSDARYSAYTAGFEATFADEAPYSVVDDGAAYALIGPVIDQLHAAWVAAGRPEPDQATPRTDAMPVERPQPDQFSMRAMQVSMDRVAAELRPAERRPPGPHAAPELEALIPADLTAPPLWITSVTAVASGSSLLRRSLKRLGVPPADVRLANAIGGSGEETLIVMLTSVPGIERELLLGEFRSVIFLPRGSWETRSVGGRDVSWTTVPEFSTAWWANDELVVQVSGRADFVEAAIPRLP